MEDDNILLKSPQNLAEENTTDAVPGQVLEYYSKHSLNQDLPKYFCGELSFKIKDWHGAKPKNTLQPEYKNVSEPLIHKQKPQLSQVNLCKNPNIIVTDCNSDKPSSPASSVASNRKLEWDNGADIGYSNAYTHTNLQKSISLPVLNRFEYKELQNKLVNQGNFIVPQPTSKSSESECEIEGFIPISSSSSSDAVLQRTPVVSTTSSSSPLQHISSSSSDSFQAGHISTYIGAPVAESTAFHLETAELGVKAIEPTKHITSSIDINVIDKVSNYKHFKMLKLVTSKPIIVECICQVKVPGKFESKFIQTSLVRNVSVGLQTDCSPIVQKVLSQKHVEQQSIIYVYHSDTDTERCTNSSSAQTDGSGMLSNHCQSFEFLCGDDLNNKGSNSRRTSSESELTNIPVSSSSSPQVSNNSPLHSISPLAQLLSSRGLNHRIPDFQEKVHLLQKMVTSCKYKESTKKFYLKKELKKMFDTKYSDDTTCELENEKTLSNEKQNVLLQNKPWTPIQQVKTKNLQVKTFTNEILPQPAPLVQTERHTQSCVLNLNNQHPGVSQVYAETDGASPVLPQSNTTSPVESPNILPLPSHQSSKPLLDSKTHSAPLVQPERRTRSRLLTLNHHLPGVTQVFSQKEEVSPVLTQSSTFSQTDRVSPALPQSNTTSPVQSSNVLTSPSHQSSRSWRDNKTLSEKVFEEIGKGDCMVQKPVKKQNEDDLTWINNEILHLNKLKKKLKQHKSDNVMDAVLHEPHIEDFKTQQSAAVYVVSTETPKDIICPAYQPKTCTNPQCVKYRSDPCPGGSKCPNQPTVTRYRCHSPKQFSPTQSKPRSVSRTRIERRSPTRYPEKVNERAATESYQSFPVEETRPSSKVSVRSFTFEIPIQSSAKKPCKCCSPKCKQRSRSPRLVQQLVGIDSSSRQPQVEKWGILPDDAKGQKCTCCSACLRNARKLERHADPIESMDYDRVDGREDADNGFVPYSKIKVISPPNSIIEVESQGAVGRAHNVEVLSRHSEDLSRRQISSSASNQEYKDCDCDRPKNKRVQTTMSLIKVPSTSSSSSSSSSTACNSEVCIQIPKTTCCRCCKRQVDFSGGPQNSKNALCRPCYLQNRQKPYYTYPGHVCRCRSGTSKVMQDIRDTVKELAVLENEKSYCTCRNSPRKADSVYCQHCKNKLKAKKGIAYTLTLEPENSHQKYGREKQSSLEEIKIKVPGYRCKPSHKENDSTSSCECCNKENCAKRHKQRKNSKERSRSKKRSLQDYLFANKPNFIESAEQRRLCLLDLAYIREQRCLKYKQIIGALADMSLKENIMENLISVSPNAKSKHLFTATEMKQITAKHYKTLPEVQQKLMDRREKQVKKANKLLTDIFNQKLRQQALRGKLTIPVTTSIIKLT